MKDSAFWNRVVTIERLLDAPIDLVWKAWTTPEHIAQWWSPQGITAIIERHEFKMGGAWKYLMPMPNGNTFIAEGVYTQIEHHKEIKSDAHFRPMTEGVEIQTLFLEVEQQTQFTFHIIHPSEEYRIQQEKMGIQNGWGSVFDRLETYIKELKTKQ